MNSCYGAFVFILLASMQSCSKDITTNTIRQGKYKCNGEYYRFCRSCMPQDSQNSYTGAIGIISFKGDSVIFENNYPMWKINNDSFVYDRGPGYPGIFYSVKFFGNDSFNFRYVQSTQAIRINQNSFCKKIE